MAAKSPFSIGIDLGTTYCCVAVLRHQSQKPEVIQNDMGKNTTPSYVSFNIDEDEDEDVYAGDAAKDEAYENPENTVFDIKRLIGRTFDDAHVQKYKHLWPFHLAEIHGLVAVKIGAEELLPQAISIRLISHLKKIAENYLGCSVDSAIVTIPVYYNELQQSVTRASCVKAGFKSVEFILEPIAAALAYSLESSIKNKGTAKTCLIFDLGGGTFDVTIFTLNAEKQVTIKAIGGDDRLGGEDFNDILTEHCLQEFKKQHGIDLTEGKESEDDELRKKVARRFRRIRSECERQKCFLTSTTQVVISLDGLIPDTPMVVPVSRKLFEDLIAGHLTRCVTTVGTVLRKAGLTKGDIDDVVIVGGSARIPKVQEVLSDYFEGKRLHMSIDADEAVACGAAIHAYNTFHGKLFASGVTLVQQTLDASINDQFKSRAVTSPVCHGGVSCDGCLVRDSSSSGHYIIGPRYKCLQCPDYDLCKPCMKKEIHEHELFVKIPVPEMFTQRVEGIMKSVSTSINIIQTPSSIFEWYRCDVCSNRIQRTLYRCIQCLDFELCTKCMRNEMHAHHLFLKMPQKMVSYRIGDLMMSVAVDESIKRIRSVNLDSGTMCNPRCNGCGNSIDMPWFKCLQCVDFDLCQQCMQKKIHAQHLFLTIPRRELYTQPLDGVLRLVDESKCFDESLLLQNPRWTMQYGAMCDGCEKRILGPCYKCLLCIDRNYCEHCWSNKKNEHPLFVEIPRPEMYSHRLADILRGVALAQSVRKLIVPNYSIGEESRRLSRLQTEKGLFSQIVDKLSLRM